MEEHGLTEEDKLRVLLRDAGRSLAVVQSVIEGDMSVLPEVTEESRKRVVDRVRAWLGLDEHPEDPHATSCEGLCIY